MAYVFRRQEVRFGRQLADDLFPHLIEVIFQPCILLRHLARHLRQLASEDHDGDDQDDDDFFESDAAHALMIRPRGRQSKAPGSAGSLQTEGVEVPTGP